MKLHTQLTIPDEAAVPAFALPCRVAEATSLSLRKRLVLPVGKRHSPLALPQETTDSARLAVLSG